MGCQNGKELKNTEKSLTEKKQNANNIILKRSSTNTANITNHYNNKTHFTQEELGLIRSSWKDITKNGDYKDYGASLMIKIFTKRPDLKFLWRFAVNLNTEEEMRNCNQLRSHGKNLFEAINAAVNSLNNIESLNILLIDLGARHSEYGAKIEHFPTVKEALLETLSEGLGSKFSNEHLNAWSNLIDYFASQMLIGMNQ